MLSRSAVVSAVVATGLLACDHPSSTTPGSAEPPGPASAAATTQAAHRMVRLDYTLTTTDPNKPPTTATYTLNVEQDRPGEVRVGKNVPLQASIPAPSGSANATASARPPLVAPRQDVGTLLKASFTSAGDDVLVRSDFEMSSADELPAIHKLVLKGDVVVPPGKSVMVAKSEDPETHRKVELTVTATKVR